MPKYPSFDELAETGEASVPTTGSSVAHDKCWDTTEIFRSILVLFLRPRNFFTVCFLVLAISNKIVNNVIWFATEQ